MSNPYALKWLAFIGIALLSFGCYLDYTVVNVALPTIQQALGATLSQLQWVMNIYFLALCVLATIMGRCGDLYGRRRLFYSGVVIFAAASLLAGFSTSISMLIFGRLLQGVGAAIVFPLGPSLLPEAFPEHERGKAIAWFGSLGGVALALGPMLGGIIVSHWGWRWIFFINIPVIVLGFLFSRKSIVESAVSVVDRALDFRGMVLVAFTLGGIVMGLSHGQSVGWDNANTWIDLVVGVVAGWLLFRVERRHPNPLINFNDFFNPIFYAGAMLCFLAGVLSAVALFFDPLYLQVIRAETAEVSGLVLFAIPIAVFLGAFVVGAWVHRIGLIQSTVIAFIIAATASFLQIFFTDISPLWYIILAFVVLGGVWAMGNTVPIIAAQAAVGPARASVATGTVVTLFNVGGSIGLSVAVVVDQVFGTRALKQFSASLNADQFSQLKQWLANPSQAMMGVGTPLHSVFNQAFMHGFSSVMVFLLVLSVCVLLSVLSFRRSIK